ncbi:MAG: CBS domain-containing protein [Planctomycetota bacterium]
MGEHAIQSSMTEEGRRGFMRALLEDVRALESMIERGWFEDGIRRIGAEQELFLIDRGMRPANGAPAMLELLDPEFFTNELGQFNLEVNLSPADLGGTCLSDLESQLIELVGEARRVARSMDMDVVMAGILPTLRKEHLTLDAMTPSPRFRQLNQVMRELRGGDFRTLIKGTDELQTTHDNVMLEACNTSFQVHFQVAPHEFAKLYNLAQLVTAPVLASAVNSPVLLRHRLWHETRVALFQQSLDTRSDTHTKRSARTRVSFGDEWIDDSVLEIFRTDIARFRVLLGADLEEHPDSVIARGGVPTLKALRLHNGTVYRWNRPCYGISQTPEGPKPHLRIENRVLPAGPTIIDEVANAAFFFGLMCAFGDRMDDVRKFMSFDRAKENFMASARYGLKARFHWIGGKTVSADDLILTELLPAAREGLRNHGIAAEDVERYCGVLEERVSKGRTGAQWVFDSLESLGAQPADQRSKTLVAAMVRHQAEELPVARWPLADPGGRDRASYRTVGQVMQTDLLTSHPEDLIDLTASVMDWHKIRYVPVEDHEGSLVGLITHRRILRHMAKRKANEPLAVREVMNPDPVTIGPDEETMRAIELMREHKVGCLPVVQEGKLVGIVTEADFIYLAAELLDRWLREE